MHKSRETLPVFFAAFEELASRGWWPQSLVVASTQVCITSCTSSVPVKVIRIKQWVIADKYYAVCDKK